MTSIPIPQISNDWHAAISKVREGETIVLTENGKPVAQLSPAAEHEEPSQKPSRGGLLWMCELAEKWASDSPESKEQLTNEDIDRIIYDH